MTALQTHSSILEVDLHGLNQHQAKIRIDSVLRGSCKGVYRIRVIHGYSGGTALRDMVRKAYRSHPKILRVELGMNPGITDLVLRELY